MAALAGSFGLGLLLLAGLAAGPTLTRRWITAKQVVIGAGFSTTAT